MVMPFVTRRQPLNLSAADREKLELLRRSRSEEKRRVLHAAILWDCANGMNDSAIAVAHGVNRHSVALCAHKFLKFGLEAALENCLGLANSVAFRMMRSPGCCTAPVKSRRKWATPTSSGRTLCCSVTCECIASKRATPA